MPMKAGRGDVEQIERHRHRQQSPGRDLSDAQQATERGPAINAQTPDADRDGRTIDHKTSPRILVAQPGEETADEQCNKGVAGGQERRRQGGQRQSEDGKRKL